MRQAGRSEIAPGHVLALAREAERRPGTVFAPVAGSGRGTETDAVRFEVRYGLGEYLAVVQERARLELEQRELARNGRPLTTLPRFARVLIGCVATPLFAWKKWRMPLCRFVIDDAGIVRRTRHGVLRASWTEVVAVRRFGTATLVEFARGALPLPHRCLDAAQRAALDRLVGRHVPADKFR